jgi:hypothetical protein
MLFYFLKKKKPANKKNPQQNLKTFFLKGTTTA